jgi:pimeloyl-ACP methyl ester carboxylesterase
VAAGYAVVALDHRGFGASTKEASSPAELTEYARSLLSEDFLGAIRAASSVAGIDSSRIAVFGTGPSTTAAVRCALETPAVQALVLFPGALGPEEEDFLFGHPDLPLLLIAAEDDDRSVGLMRQYAGRFSGPPQTYLEMRRVTPHEPADWRGTDGLQRDTGLADALLWFLANHFPGSSGS